MSAGPRRAGAAGVLALALGVLAGAAPAPEGGLPDQERFLRQVSARLRSDQEILRQYAYTRSVEERDRDGSGRVTATRRRVYEVWPLPDDPEGFRIELVREDGPVPEPDVAEARAEYRARLAAAQRARAGESAAAHQRRERRDAEARRQTEAVLADVRTVFDVALVRRETMNGIPSVLVSFEPRPQAQPRTREGRLLTRVAGRAWFSEAEQELVRVEAAAIAPIRYGWGILARIDTGSRAVIDRQRHEDGAWVPARYELTGSGRLLLLKAIDRDATVKFTDLRPVRLE